MLGANGGTPVTNLYITSAPCSLACTVLPSKQPVRVPAQCLLVNERPDDGQGLEDEVLHVARCRGAQRAPPAVPAERRA